LELGLSDTKANATCALMATTVMTKQVLLRLAMQGTTKQREQTTTASSVLEAMTAVTESTSELNAELACTYQWDRKSALIAPPATIALLNTENLSCASSDTTPWAKLNHAQSAL